MRVRNIRTRKKSHTLFASAKYNKRVSREAIAVDHNKSQDFHCFLVKIPFTPYTKHRTASKKACGPNKGVIFI